MEREWFNFENSLNSPQTKRQYVFCLKQFLIFTKNNLHRFLMLKMQQQEELTLKKEQTSYSDLLDALRLALKGYQIE